MKKIFIILILSCILVINYGCSAHTTIEEGDALLRVHIRANGKTEQDQTVKLKVRDAVTQRLSSIMRNVQSLDTAKQIISEERTTLQRIANKVLMENGEDYGSRVRLTNQFFTTQTCGNTTVKSGYYDALIIDLGQGKGDNWWCIIYPTQYFSSDNSSIIYKSRIVEWLQNLFT